MIGRLSAFITAVKEWIYRHPTARLIWYTLALALLLGYWLFAPQAEISFVYNAF